MDGRVKRPDLCNFDIATEWLKGESQLDLAITFDCSPQTINTRLAHARREFPDLPWDERPDPRTGAREASPTRGYVKMNDGKPGESMIREGSVIKSRSMRMRSR